MATHSLYRDSDLTRTVLKKLMTDQLYWAVLRVILSATVDADEKKIINISWIFSYWERNLVGTGDFRQNTFRNDIYKSNIFFKSNHDADPRARFLVVLLFLGRRRRTNAVILDRNKLASYFFKPFWPHWCFSGKGVSACMSTHQPGLCFPMSDEGGKQSKMLFQNVELTTMGCSKIGGRPPRHFLFGTFSGGLPPILLQPIVIQDTKHKNIFRGEGGIFGSRNQRRSIKT